MNVMDHARLWTLLTASYGPDEILKIVFLAINTEISVSDNFPIAI